MGRFESGASVGFAMVRGLLGVVLVLMRCRCGRTGDETFGIWIGAFELRAAVC